MEITFTAPDALVSRAKARGLSAEIYIERLLDEVATASADRERGRLREQADYVS